ncbi:Polypeptide N-acetylgalactosaminyltransferase 18 [Microtus ochrogaster]|uniref:Polypeptide N-acetylgalactosaminyltransferase n=1 Tax=Microtus ochrogaster TaxID=79684 RepID=A0A8J6KKN1_MICOH|nr:Polypeptide N-acetylgalactosaminyltransferase 18 [Microtus ochrogaster]
MYPKPGCLHRCAKLYRYLSHHPEAPAKPEEAEAEPFTDSSLFAHWGQELSPEGRRVALKQFQYYGYNAYLSDRLPLDRPLPDLRPSGCRNLSFPDSLPEVSIVFIFVNEALSVLLRSIHSAMERTPPHLLKEIILVDDNSSNAAPSCGAFSLKIDFLKVPCELRKGASTYPCDELHLLCGVNLCDTCRSLGLTNQPDEGSWAEELKEKLTEYVDKVNGQKPGFIKVVRHSKQEGLIRSRVSGWRAATAPVVALFDAHVEFNVGWAEPVLTRIKENRKRIISPSFDNIKYDNFEIEEYPLAAQGFDWELWCRYLNPPKAWWKLENSTAPIRSPALIGCFIVDRQYFQEIGLLDEGMEVYGGENVELGIRVWQCGGSVEVLPCSRIAHIERAHKPYTEDLTAHVRRNALRVAEVWMDEFKSHVYMAWNIPQEDSGIDIGDITARKALRKQLQCKTFRWYLVSVYPEMRMYSDIIAYGVLQNSLKTDLCLDQGPDTENVPIVYICHGMTPQGGSIQNRKSKRCLELQENSDMEFGFQLVLQQCSGQHWTITNVLRSLVS